jgi:hypothetical protein
MTVIQRDEYEKLIIKIVDYLLEFANFDDAHERTLHQKLSPEIMSECAVLLLRTTQTAKAWMLINMLVRRDDFAHQIDSEGCPYHKNLLDAFEIALSDGSLNNASNCLELIARHNPKFDLRPYVGRVTTTFQLGTMQKQVLLNFNKE